MAQTASRPRPDAPSEFAATGLPIASKVTILGLVLYGVSMAIALLTTVIIGAGIMTVFFGASLVVTAVLIALVARFRAWALVLTALLMLLNLAVSGIYMVAGLRFPASFFDFVTSLVSVAGSPIALGGAIVALIARRRHATRSAPTRTERTLAGGFLAALAALAVLSGVLTLVNRESVAAEAKVGALPVRMKGTKFEPEWLRVRAGQSVRLLIKDSDPGAHSFVIEALDADVTVHPGSERLVEIADLAPGEYPYVCKLFGHEDFMKGVLVVVPEDRSGRLRP